MLRHKFSIVRILEKAFNYVDPRLMNHGKRVAYMTYKTLKKQGKHDRDYLHKMTLAALLHDIGAYKTEEIDEMVRFETQKVWEHSIYGYLFLKYFSPLPEMAPAILFHHASCRELEYAYPHYREAAQIIKISDRFDIFLSSDMKADPAHARPFFERKRDEEFASDFLDLFFANEQGDSLSHIDGIGNEDEFHDILYGRGLSNQEIDGFIKMLILSIDFRSPQTVLHTFSAAYACKAASKILGVDPEEQDRMLTGIMLHDIGKIGIPVNILNKNGKLTPDEMAVMKKHVDITEDILSGELEDRVLQMAVRHHEKLDGSGYPKGLKAESLTESERIIAVTDIFSALTGTRSYKDPFPKTRVAGILDDMAAKGQLDPHIVSVFTDNYDRITEEVDRKSAPVVEAYNKLTAEYAELDQVVSFLGSPSVNGGIYRQDDSAASRQERKHAFWASLTRPTPPIHLDFFRDEGESYFL